MTFYIIIRGPLGIGKSTISKELAKKLKAEYISIDKIMEDNALDKVDERLGSIPVENFIKTNNIILPKIKSNLESGKPVIIDGCFYHMEQIQHFRDNLPFMAYAFNLKAKLSTCINRDKGRERTYGKGAAKAVYNLVSKFNYGVDLNTENKSPKDCVKEILDYIRAYEES